MIEKHIHILLVEDNMADARLLEEELRDTEEQFTLTHVQRLSAGIGRIQVMTFDIILLDLSLPDASGLQTFSDLQSEAKHIPIIVLTGLNDKNLALEAVRAGAQDYLVKGQLGGEALFRSIAYAIERSELQAKLVTFAAAEERMRVMKQFMQDVAHDLRTPLTSMIMSLDLLNKYLKDYDNPKVKRHLDTLEVQTHRLQEMVQDVFDMFNLDTEKFATSMHYNLVGVNTLVGELIREHESHAQRKQHQLDWSPFEYEVFIRADKAQLKRAVGNLILNAINYTPEGGRIEIKLGTIMDTIYIEVKDNGIGIPEEEIEHIFDHFYRADKARSATTGGTGLGLAIVKKIVELHHGEIMVNSEPDVGSKFRIILPLPENSEEVDYLQASNYKINFAD